MIQEVSQVAKQKQKLAFAEEKILGREPVIEGIVTKAQLIDALNWYNYLYSGADGKKWLMAYLKKNRPEVVQTIDALPDYAIRSTACFLCRMIQNGSVLDTPNRQYLNQAIDEMASYKKPESKVTIDSTQKVSIVDRTSKKTERLLAEIEETVDSAWDNNFESDFSLYNFLTASEAASQSIKKIQEFYSISCEEMLKYPEAFNQNTYKAALKFYQGLVSDCDRMLNNKKIVRKPRESAVKKISKDDVVKNLKYCSKFDPLKLVSVNPTEIIGAKQLWIYNTKYKMLGVYNAADDMGFKISSTTLLNFDEKTSISKTIRKPEEALTAFFQAGKVGLRTFLDQFKTTETKLASRINENIILLKVIK